MEGIGLENLLSGGTVNKFPGRLAIQQRVLPIYRAPFFELLASQCEGGVTVFSGDPLSLEGIHTKRRLLSANYNRGKNIHFTRPSSSNYFCWQTGLVTWLEKWNPDALIVEANPRILSTRMAISWMHLRQRPVLGWGLGAPEISNSLLNRIRKGFLESLDGIISYSARGEQEYRNLGFTKVYTAYNAVTSKPAEEPFSRSMKLDGSPTLLYVGRLQKRKRIDVLLKACSVIPENQQPNLIIVGDGPYQKEIEEIARKEYPQAQFVGSKHGNQLTPFFNQADLFVLPGTGGLAVQQAMSHGLPIIVAEGDGTQEDLVRPGNGWLIPPENQDTLRDVILEAISDIPRLRKMGAESFRIVKEEINLEIMVEKFIEVLKGVSE
jgi:glycosyltransferase involved in cell wall biosynthesis